MATAKGEEATSPRGVAGGKPPVDQESKAGTAGATSPATGEPIRDRAVTADTASTIDVDEDPLALAACCAQANPDGAAGAEVTLAPEDRAILGEWRHVESILTVSSDASGLLLRLEPGQASIRLERTEPGRWQASKPGDSEPYGVLYDGKNTLRLQKGGGGAPFFVHRVAQTKTMLGRWEGPGGKTVEVLPASSPGGELRLQSEGRPSLRLLRRALLEWEARTEETEELTYLLEHTEGTSRIFMRRPEGSSNAGKAIELKRMEPEPAPSAPAGGRRARSRSHGGEASDFEEFVSKNALSKRTVAALRGMSKKDQRTIMGRDGGRNGFMLLGNVRDPDAVVMSRISRIQTENALRKRPSRERSRRAGRPPRKSRTPSDSRSRSYSYYSDSRSPSGRSSERDRRKKKNAKRPAKKAKKEKEKVAKKAKRERKDRKDKKKRKR